VSSRISQELFLLYFAIFVLRNEPKTVMISVNRTARFISVGGENTRRNLPGPRRVFLAQDVISINRIFLFVYLFSLFDMIL